MAIYVPAARRRRRLFMAAGAALVVGVALGLLLGRVTAPSLTDQVRSVQEQARTVSAQLRVLSLHQEANTAAAGNGAADFALKRARTDLEAATAAAPWISPAERQLLLALLDRVVSEAAAGTSRPEFAQAADQAASEIDRAFGLA